MKYVRDNNIEEEERVFIFRMRGGHVTGEVSEINRSNTSCKYGYSEREREGYGTMVGQ